MRRRLILASLLVALLVAVVLMERALAPYDFMAALAHRPTLAVAMGLFLLLRLLVILIVPSLVLAWAGRVTHDLLRRRASVDRAANSTTPRR